MINLECPSNDQIINYLVYLSKSFGIKKEISSKLITEITHFISQKDYNQAILRIKNHCHLNMKLFVKFEKEKNPFSGLTNFSSENLIDNPFYGFSDYFNPKKEIAAVLIPKNLPLYSSKEFKNAEVRLVIQNRLKRDSLETFISAIAHEMAHVVLYSTRHPLNKSEIATDLMAMLLGFSKTMKVGSRGKMGYLSVEQFDLAYHWICQKNGNPVEKLFSFFWQKLN